MEKINFINDTTPALNATNLNKIQQNTEEAIDEKLNISNVKDIYSTSPTDVYSCNYVNDILESGSNTNGNWYKFNNGLMICTLYKTGDSISNSQYGDSILYTANYSWTFPQEFYAMPTAICSTFRLSTGASWGSVLAVSKTTAALYSYDTYQRTNVSYTLSATAIGRWK